MADFQRYCMALDLKDEPDLIQRYVDYHADGKAWPEITQSIKGAGIINMEIYLIANRLFMIMDVDDSFSFAEKAKMDADNPKVQEWESLMQNFQQALPWASNGEMWMKMDKIYQLPA